MQKIGWIGVGIMGKAMVRNLMKAGYQLHIYARHPEKVADVVSEGAVFHDSIADCVKASDVVITMVASPRMWRRFISLPAPFWTTPPRTHCSLI